MTDSEYALLANAVTSLDAEILRQMKRRAELKERLVNLLDVADMLRGKDDMQSQIQLRNVLKETRRAIETL